MCVCVLTAIWHILIILNPSTRKTILSTNKRNVDEIINVIRFLHNHKPFFSYSPNVGMAADGDCIFIDSAHQLKISHTHQQFDENDNDSEYIIIIRVSAFEPYRE